LVVHLQLQVMQNDRQRGEAPQDLDILNHRLAFSRAGPNRPPESPVLTGNAGFAPPERLGLNSGLFTRVPIP
jgi:hypothetical protein